MAVLVLAVLCGLSIYSDLAGPAGPALDHGAADLLGGARVLVPVALAYLGWIIHPGSGAGGLGPARRRRVGPARPRRSPGAAASGTEARASAERRLGGPPPAPARVAVGGAGPAGRRWPA